MDPYHNEVESHLQSVSTVPDAKLESERKGEAGENVGVVCVPCSKCNIPQASLAGPLLMKSLAPPRLP